MGKIIEIKNLIVNYGEALRIVIDGKNTKYLVLDELLDQSDFGVLIHTDRNSFIEAFKKLNWIENSWSTDLKRDYKDMKEFLERGE